ncbi:MAG: type II/IV secretion system protein [Candidatus Riflebacteria bacterium]|nr:type II/IV secretion system protein [Candidatus Riflebacteria bacterium]
MIIKRMKLGEMLLEAKKITKEQLQQALDEQLKTHKRLGEVLVEMGFVDQDTLVNFLADQLKIPRMSLVGTEVEKAALELLPPEYCKKNLVCPFKIDGNKLHLCISDPMNIFLVDEIEHRTGKKVQTFLEAPAVIKNTLDKLHSGDESRLALAAEQLDDKEAMAGLDETATVDLQKIEGPIVSLAHQVIEKAITEKASDIHVEPGEKSLRVRFRVDGVLQELLKIPPSLQKFANELTSRLKLMANMDISEKRIPQDGRIRVAHGEKNIDIRVNTMPVAKGEKVCMRLLDSSSTKLDLKDLGFSEHNSKIFESLVDHPHGLVLVTGPTGSGKTSTLYAALNYVYNPGENTCTVEDPIEYQIPVFNQTQVRSNIGLTFASCLRAILRQDPDIILIGEIRDAETAGIAVEAALTGHLVFSTLHTNSASAAVARLIELDVETYMIASTLLGVVAQRLCRRLCPKCKQEADVTEAIVEFGQSRFGKDLTGRKMYVGGGCPSCKNMGYSGRCGIHEILENTTELRQQILARADSESIAESAKERGFLTLIEDGYLKVLQGTTSLEEVRRVAR